MALGKPAEQNEVTARELVVIGECGNFCDAGKRDIAPRLRRAAEPTEPVAEEAPEHLRKPARAVEGVGDSGPPFVSSQPGMSPNLAAGPCAPIEKQRVHVRESRQVAERLADKAAALPVDDAGCPRPGSENISEPEIAVDCCAGKTAFAEPAVDFGEPAEVGLKAGKLGAAASQLAGDAGVHLDGQGIAGGSVLQGGEPAAD